MYQKIDPTEELNYDKDAAYDIKCYFKDTLSHSEIDDSGRSIASSYCYQPKAFGVLEKSKLAKGRDEKNGKLATTNITAPISPRHFSTKCSLDGAQEEEEKMREFSKISKSRVDEEDHEEYSEEVMICGKSSQQQ